LGLPFKDLTGGYNCWRRDVIERIGPDRIFSEGFCFHIEMKYKAHKFGYKILEVPIIFENRLRGKSKMSSKVFWEALFQVWRLKFKSIE
jgi:dolichol-phosphate mannosyltransferase